VIKDSESGGLRFGELVAHLSISVIRQLFRSSRHSGCEYVYKVGKMPHHEGDGYTELLENWRFRDSSARTDFDSEVIRAQNIHVLPRALPTAPNKNYQPEGIILLLLSRLAV